MNRAISSWHRRVLDDLHGDAAGPQQPLFADEGPVLADDHARNSVEEDGAAAHGAGRERGVERALTVDPRGLTAPVFQRVHLAVPDDAALLDPPVVTAPEDAPTMLDDGADRDSAPAQAELRFLDGDAQELVHGPKLAHPTPRGQARGPLTPLSVL
jgi:hypothetical protein